MLEVAISKGIEVGSFHYEVLQSDEIEKELQSASVFGKCDNMHHRLKITKAFSPEQVNNTFTHECIEAVNYVYCNDLLKHPQIVNLGNGLAQIFKSLDIQFVYEAKGGE